MDNCHIKTCTDEGTNYRDFSIGGCGDIRLYCDGHVEAADKAQHLVCLKRTVSYRKSVIENLNAQLDAAQRDLRQAELELGEYDSGQGPYECAYS